MTLPAAPTAPTVSPSPRYMCCERAQVPEGAKAVTCATLAIAHAWQRIHVASLAEGWALQTVLHPLTAAARDDVDNMQRYPYAVVDLESIPEAERTPIFLLALTSAESGVG